MPTAFFETKTQNTGGGGTTVAMTITGTVKNVMGAVVSGASVRAIFSNGTSVSVATSAAGAYAIAGNYPVGACTIIITPPSHYIQNLIGVKDIVVAAGANAVGLVEPVPVLQSGFLADGSRRADELPYNVSSLWNIPIDTSGVTYVPAGITFRTEDGYLTRFDQDEEVLAMDASAPQIPVYRNNVGWDNGGVGRCNIQGGQVASVRIDPDFVTGEDLGNNSSAFLNSDKRTLQRMQPWAKCATGVISSTSLVEWPNTDNQSANYLGPHGGSGFDAAGGSLMAKEIWQGVIRHRIKINLRAQTYYNYARGVISPADRRDGYASPTTYGGANTNLAPGAWLALRPDFLAADYGNLQTEPGRMFALNLLNYGGHVTDDVGGYNAWMICTQWGPQGRAISEFQRKYGISMKRTDDGAHPFSQDIISIFSKLYIITSYTAGNPGGGNGVPRVAKVTNTFGSF